jgi:hypothetical protein
MSATDFTPIEELQAAHKRLSELRHGATPGPWTAVNDDDFEEIDISGAAPFNVGSVWTRHSADLIVTLHRTIDTQLSILDAGITLHGVDVDTEGLLRVEDVRLARAINGSDHA